MQALLTLNESFCTDTKRYSEYLWLVDRPGWCSPERLLLVVTDVCGWLIVQVGIALRKTVVCCD